MMPESRSPIHTATAGASAALFTWAVVLPLDVLRTRVQARAMAETGQAPSGLVSELMSVVRSHGVKGLWAGWAPISIRAVSASLSMTAYESLK
eukprot:symbB.v1.2.009469.t1/scaffold600.1/size182905/9